jgi:3,4-dihydroxy 2-butanone 4-phosphate synthase/GTP cyclohydrolase II
MLLQEAVHVPLPTPFGLFDLRAFEQHDGNVYVAMVRGDLGEGDDVLVRLHSECLTGDALGSLRCDCGVQLRLGLRLIAAEGRGVLVYATGHEGRGIGLIDKLRAYVAQDAGADTVDANLALGLPVDARDYTASAAVLAALGIGSVRLLTNNPLKVEGLRAAGTTVTEVVPLPTAPHHRNLGYLTTKLHRLGHVRPTGEPIVPVPAPDERIDPMRLLGPVRSRPDRPFVALKYAQTLDGRIATSTGDARWISGEPERRVSHSLRAASDAVLVGIGTVFHDDPQLTVRMVPGASPVRVVVDSTLRTPDGAKVLGPDAATTIMTTERSDPARRDALRRAGTQVEVVPAGDDGRVALAAMLARLRANGVESVLVEGGSQIITALFAAGLVDRVIVAIAPIVIGEGTQAVNGLGVERVMDGIRLGNRTVVPVGDDVLLAWDVSDHSV